MCRSGRSTPFRRDHGYDNDAIADRKGRERPAGDDEEPTPMLQITETAVMDALRHVQEPELGGDLVTRNMVKDLVIDGAKVAFQIELTTPACPLKDEIESRVHAALDPIGVESIELTWGASVRRAAPRTAEQLLPGVKNVIAVASGKGGVGKSTVAVNLAVALARDGASVGLLDADITGPNVPIMLGLEGQPQKSEDNKIVPLVRHGVKAISIQFFVPAGQPIIWRGPLVGGAITQFLRDVEWGELDYLVIDMPPGTSDAQLTLAQAVPVSGAVLVTTPQEVSLLDVEKALAMFKRMSVPVLGLVENMAGFICPHCGELTELFGRGGGERFAGQNGLEFLGGIPLDVTVRQGGDVGVPAVAQREPGPAATALTSIARTIAARMSVRAANASQPVLTIS
jgi:ATP-binding protein involved in chromosome partitioning